MSEELGQAVLEEQRSSYLGDNVLNVKEKDYSEATAREVDLVVRQLIENAYEQAKAILEKRSKDLNDGAQLLLKNETITPDDFPPLRPADNAKESAE
jgi:cell division protease FtsH